MIAPAAAPRASRILSWLAGAAALWLAILLLHYFLTPLAPRHRLESAFMILGAAGIAATWTRTGGPGNGVEHGAGFGAAGIGVLAVLFGAGVLQLYGSALGIGLLSDDFVLLDWARRGEWIHREETGFVRPAVPLFWAALLRLPGAFDVTAHAANLALHAVNAVLVSLLATRLRLPRADAVLAGALFLSFPAFTEAVVWASGTQDVLMTTLVLAAVLAATPSPPQVADVSDTCRSGVADVSDTWGRWGVAGLATVGALGVKETAVVIPALVGLAWWGGARRPRWWTLATVVAVVAGYTGYRVSAGLPSSYFPELSRYFVKQLMVEPFASLGAPWTASWADAHPLVAVGRSLAIVGLLFLGLATWTRQADRFRAGLAASAWVLIAILPVFTLFHVADDLQGSRYLYLPGVGFALLLAVLAGQAAALTSRPLAPAVLAGVALVLMTPSLPAIRFEEARWKEAARARDAILGGIEQRAPIDGCGSFAAEGLADNVDGAYVFRNGLPQALAARRRPPIETADGRRPSRACQVTWDGQALAIVPLR